jgi:hypothetical protein
MDEEIPDSVSVEAGGGFTVVLCEPVREFVASVAVIDFVPTVRSVTENV